MSERRRIPSYRLLRARNCAVGASDGTDHYLGAYNSPQRWEKYHRLLAERAANGRMAPSAETLTAPDVAVDELIVVYWRFAQEWYVKDGKPSGRFWPGGRPSDVGPCKCGRDADLRGTR